MRPAKTLINRGIMPLFMVLLVGCTESRGMPSAWGPLRLAADSTCPPVYGSYDASDADLAHIMVVQHLPYDTTRGRVESLSLVLQNDSVLTAIAWIDREPRDTVNLHRGLHFQCADGWLQPEYPQQLPSYDADLEDARAYRGRTNAVRVARTRDGSLVARIDHHTFDEFSIWAPGGADLPIPWTWRVQRVWHRAAVVQPQTHRATAPARRLTDLNERLLHEEARLEGRD